MNLIKNALCEQSILEKKYFYFMRLYFCDCILRKTSNKETYNLSIWDISGKEQKTY